MDTPVALLARAGLTAYLQGRPLRRKPPRLASTLGGSSGKSRGLGQESDAGVSARAVAAAMPPQEGMAMADAGAWDLASAVKRLTE